MSMPGAEFGIADEVLESYCTGYRAGLFEGKVALVSGGGSGIGKATAWLLARLGAKVVICGRDSDKLARTVDGLARYGRAVTAHRTDIREPERVNALFDAVWEEHGRLDVLINNAGGQFPKPAMDLSVNGWNAVVNNNLNGTWYMMQAAARAWRDHEQPGNIVNVVAVVERGMVHTVHTCAARAGIIYGSKTVAVEWAPYRIRVNCVAPGSIETEGMHSYPEHAKANFHRSNPMLRLGDVWDVAEACIYLGSGMGKFITGELLTVDGGGQLWGEVWTAGKPDYFRTSSRD
jgi:citronellol/citronellal dehydrogenase